MAAPALQQRHLCRKRHIAAIRPIDGSDLIKNSAEARTEPHTGTLGT